MTGVSLQGPLAGVVLVVLGLYLLFAPIDRLARKPSPLKRGARARRKPVPLWMKVFFRGLGLALLAFAALLLAPLFTGQ